MDTITTRPAGTVRLPVHGESKRTIDHTHDEERARLTRIGARFDAMWAAWVRFCQSEDATDQEEREEAWRAASELWIIANGGGKATRSERHCHPAYRS